MLLAACSVHAALVAVLFICFKSWLCFKFTTDRNQSLCLPDQSVKYSVEASSSLKLTQAWKRHVASWQTNVQLTNLFATVDSQIPIFFSICVVFMLSCCK